MLEQALIDFSSYHRLTKTEQTIATSCSLGLETLDEGVVSPAFSEMILRLRFASKQTSGCSRRAHHHHRLNNCIQQSHLEESVVSQLRTLVSSSLATTSTGTNQAFQPDRIQHARRCIKAVMLKLYLPETHGFTAKQLEHLRIAFHNAAMRRLTFVVGLCHSENRGGHHRSSSKQPYRSVSFGAQPDPCA